MKIFKIILSLVLIIMSISCTENQRARRLGGKMTVTLPKGMKLNMATWKDSNLFYLMEEMDSTYIPKTKIFKENSSWGMMQTEVKFVESR